MKKFLAILLLTATAFTAYAQQVRTYNQAELDALLAPIALYPDPLLSQVLMAATYPQDVAEAASWSRANPQIRGEDAVRAAQPYPWDPSVKSLLAFPDVLARMDESPQWTVDLGQAFLVHEPLVMDTVQALRRRAQATGYLRSDQYQVVQQQGPAIAVVPVQPQVVYVPYYSPYVVYGSWWWPQYRPVVWRAWRPAPVVVSVNYFRTYRSAPRWQAYHRVPEAQRQPIVRSLPPAVRVETPRRNDPRVERRHEERAAFRVEGRNVQRKAPPREQRREARQGKDGRG